MLKAFNCQSGVQRPFQKNTVCSSFQGKLVTKPAFPSVPDFKRLTRTSHREEFSDKLTFLIETLLSSGQVDWNRLAL